MNILYLSAGIKPFKIKFHMEDLFNNFFDFLLYSFVIPCVGIIDQGFKILFSPVLGKSSFLIVLIVSIAASLLSFLSGFLFRDKKSDKLNKDFKERISSLKHADKIDDPSTRKGIKKGINTQADEIYENLMMEKFFNLGLTYFIPMFIFLIWLEYSVFPEKTVVDLNFIPGLNGFSLGVSLMFLIMFNLNLIILYIVKRIKK